MTEVIDLNDFDGPRDICHYIESLDARGVLYIYVDENTIITFEDENEYIEWMERGNEPDGFFETQSKRERLKSMVDNMSQAEIDMLLDELDTDGML